MFDSTWFGKNARPYLLEKLRPANGPELSQQLLPQLQAIVHDRLSDMADFND